MVIKKYTIEYDLNFKPEIHAIINIEPDLKDISIILKELIKIEEINDIWRLSGDSGLFLKIKIPSIAHFNSFIEERISSIEGIKIVETCIITDIVK